MSTKKSILIPFHKKALFDDFIPWISAGIFLFIAYLLLFFVKDSHRENMQGSFDYYHALLGSNTRLIATLQAPLDRKCPWLSGQSSTDREATAKKNLIEKHGKNPYFSNLDWLILFMKLQPKKEINELGDNLFKNYDPSAQFYLEGYTVCALPEPPSINMLLWLRDKAQKGNAKVVNSFLGTNVLSVRDEIITFGITVPSPDLEQEPFAFNYKIQIEDE